MLLYFDKLGCLLILSRALLIFNFGLKITRRRPLFLKMAAGKFYEPIIFLSKGGNGEGIGDLCMFLRQRTLFLSFMAWRLSVRSLRSVGREFLFLSSVPRPVFPFFL